MKGAARRGRDPINHKRGRETPPGRRIADSKKQSALRGQSVEGARQDRYLCQVIDVMQHIQDDDHVTRGQLHRFDISQFEPGLGGDVFHCTLRVQYRRCAQIKPVKRPRWSDIRFRDQRRQDTLAAAEVKNSRVARNVSVAQERSKYGVISELAATEMVRAPAAAPEAVSGASDTSLIFGIVQQPVLRSHN